MNYFRQKSLFLLLYAFLFSSCKLNHPINLNKIRFEFLSLDDNPIIRRGDLGTFDNKFGFEGGTAHKVNGKYYIFTTEIFDEPKTAAVRLALWRSDDGQKFQKQLILATTNYNWRDTTYRMSPWSPMAVYDDQENRWNVFYVGYKLKPGSNEVYNMSGKIRRLISNSNGPEGIEGPYKDDGFVEFKGKPDSWEGICGIVSFFPTK